MPLTKYLAPSRTILLHSADKVKALEELAAALNRDDPSLDDRQALRLIEEHEAAVSSRITDHLALPHCVLPDYDRQMLAVGYSARGIPWDSPTEPPVHLVAMSVCGQAQAEEHIHMLAELARALRDEEVMIRLAKATSGPDVYRALRGPLTAAPEGLDPQKLALCREFLRHANELAEKTRANSLMILADGEAVTHCVAQTPSSVPRILVVDDADKHAQLSTEATSLLLVPFQGLRRTHRLKLAFLFALSHGMVDKDHTVVCVSGDPGGGTLRALEIVNVAEEFHVLLSLRGEADASDIRHHVLDRALHIATALAREGREGRPVGAIFVLGDYDNVRRNCHQLVMNPFRGYPESERNLLDPGLEETIKEFSRIDGAFLIRGDGVVMSMGSYIQTENATRELPSGLGARHAAGVAITAKTQALSIVVSESTRRISLYRRGQLVMALDQAWR